MTTFLADPDVTLYHGDALEVLRSLPDGSVDCCVTSPPYWGLRDYGTGSWDGGDPDCDHKAPPTGGPNPERYTTGGGEMYRVANDKLYADVCGKCGARRIDRQMGLEPTPDLFVQGMVELFREVRRVLAAHGTCWVNLGDSYANIGRSGRKESPGVGAKQEIGKVDRRLKWQAGGGHNFSWALPTEQGDVKAKDLVGIPWRVAFALQADGWWLRSDIIWAKPNPMPESVTDRPTKSHEYVFLLTKQPRYWFDTEAVRERYIDSRSSDPTRMEDWRTGKAYDDHQAEWAGPAKGPDGRRVTKVEGRDGSEQHRNGERWPNPTGRNVRSVWTIATQPYPEAHFATFPEELARRCILAGCPVRVCRVCGKPSERIVEVERVPRKTGGPSPSKTSLQHGGPGGAFEANLQAIPTTVGWSDCGHNQWRPGVTLDPFIGSGTTAKVARDHQRHAIGIDLNHQYLQLAARRLQQLSLLGGAA